jgi:epoxyqueuosine reductase
MELIDRQPPVSVDMGDLSKDIRHQALALGFDKVGIVPANVLEPERRLLREWLARGYHADMKWMERDPEQRSDPQKVFPEARSVVVVAINYYSPEQHEGRSGMGKVSRYAWGDDYHDIVRRKLILLLDWIRGTVPEAEGKVCVDIQPLMDKAWAVRAGLGWLGKHTNLITPELGSWVFIGELLVNLELDYDRETIEDHCGTCTLCIDACPTDALNEPYVLDSSRCISYITIESRAADISAPLAQQLSGWFYGCDICQDVCPWNRFATVSDEKGFRPRPGNVNTQLEEVIQLSAEDYAERYRGSAMKRAKLSGLQRNAGVLLRTESGNDPASERRAVRPGR